MERLRAIIVDDEDFARNILKKLIEANCPELEVVGEAENVENTYNLISDTKPNLVFLDIHLAEDNSFNLFKKFEDIPFEVIFTTGDGSYGIPAIKVNAIDYLLKPIDRDDLKLAVKKVLKKKIGNTAAHQETDKTITIHVKDKVEYIRTSEITSLQAQDNYTQIFTSDGKNFLASKTLGDFEELLKDNPSFIRIHRSVIVNVNYVLTYSKKIPYIIEMNDGNSFEISRRKRVEVIALLKEMV